MGTPQLNLHYTDQVSEADNNYRIQHYCLRVAAYNETDKNNRGILSYCMNELSPIFEIEKSSSFSKFTFDDLSKQNITSQQLYLWSAPIDLIEDYQFYLNQLSTSNDSSLAIKVFYNCTIPRFGPMCQYELDYDQLDYSSIDNINDTADLFLNKIISYIYRSYGYNPTNLTCYMHLKCNRGPSPTCLDWTEICNGQIDCVDGGQDEEHCWQLEINECKDNEYRCHNGQCISESPHRDDSNASDCIDGTDEKERTLRSQTMCHKHDVPSIQCEDRTCSHNYVTSSCVTDRVKLLIKAMLSNHNSSISEDCWSAFNCLFNSEHSPLLSCDNFCKQNDCIEIINNTCPEMVYVPNVPVLFSNIYFAFIKNNLHYLASMPSMLLYLCYQTSDYDDYFVNFSKMLYNNMTCVHSAPFSSHLHFSVFPMELFYEMGIPRFHQLLNRYHLIFNYTSEVCNRSSMYQCIHSSKCISVHRLMDSMADCPHMDDENITVISQTDKIKQVKRTHFYCHLSNKYISQSVVRDWYCDCGNIHGWCEDEDLEMTYIKKSILFQYICDGFIDLLPITIEGRNETDETECEQWKCDNIYTHHNDIWNCPNGEDEGGYKISLILNCSSKHHLCVSFHSNQFICLSIEQANDGKVDCIGATDEPTLCEAKTQLIFHNPIPNSFYCRNQSPQSCISRVHLCDGYNDCQHGDDEQFCNENRTSDDKFLFCPAIKDRVHSDVEKFLCDYQPPRKKWKTKYFILDNMIKLDLNPVNEKKNTVPRTSSMIELSDQNQSRCHRGLNLLVWLNDTYNSTSTTCLCPPNYYGDKCQYQNQRVSLTIRFRAASSSWQTLFAIVISLIDDSEERIIHSYEQFTYLSVRDCKIKFYTYLLYSTRPKNSTKHYLIHIDIYKKDPLTYRGSLLFPITFPFLPVQRLAFIIDIPHSNDNIQHCSDNECIHGQCIKYSNNPAIPTFCQCEQGWSGKYCSIPFICKCASDSLCIGVAANNRSVCVCPIDKFGPRCLLINTVCQTNDNLTCLNGGQCIPNDDYIISKHKFTCICPNGYSGHQCEIVDNKLLLSFDKDILLSQSIFIHFIEVIVPIDGKNTTPNRGTTFKTILNIDDSIIVHWLQPFHLVFIELFKKNYYLAIIERFYNRSTEHRRMIKLSDRCPHISELFDRTFAELHLIRRIKYYHLPCQKYSSNLSCFYDDVHLCLCYDFNQQRLANCFNFDHNMKFDCYGQNECENGGQCLQDRPDCPQRSICICRSCYYGKQCQFSTSGFGLSLDAILGYHILPHLTITQQPLIVQISLSLTTIFIAAGLINGIFSLITFKNKVVCEVGCGIYLLGSSITTLLITVMFGLKFWILVLSQMTIISNRSFLSFQCHSFDFLLRICLHMDQWLNACVALERAITAIKDVRFKKKQSKRIAKIVIIILLLVIAGTSIHDPIYRQLIDEKSDDDINNTEKRIWCIIRYSSSLEVYNYVIHIFHFFGPFLINLVSAVILIRKRSYQQSTIQTNRPFKELLREQFRRHRHLLTAPVVLIILAIPRLIISFISKCMKSTNEAWLYLIGYFISFIPPMLTCIVFILPSKFYKKELYKTFIQYRTYIKRRLHFIS